MNKELFEIQQRVINSDYFKVLSNKTQVYFNANRNMSNRLTHSLNVANHSKNILSNIPDYDPIDYNLNIIYLGGLFHDIGHVAFGHTGETCFQKLIKKFIIEYDSTSEIIEWFDIDKLDHANLGANLFELLIQKSGITTNTTLKIINIISSHNGEDNTYNYEYNDFDNDIPIYIVKLIDKIVYLYDDIIDYAKFYNKNYDNLIKDYTENIIDKMDTIFIVNKITKTISIKNDIALKLEKLFKENYKEIYLSQNRLFQDKFCEYCYDILYNYIKRFINLKELQTNYINKFNTDLSIIDCIILYILQLSDCDMLKLSNKLSQNNL